MAKGISMGTARKKGCGDKVFNICELNNEDKGELLCHHCSAEVTYVSEYKRKEKVVSAYLRLGQEEVHDEDCRFTVQGAVDTLVAESQAVEDYAPIFEVQDDGTYLFRMNVLVEAHKVAEQIDDLIKQGDGDLEKVYKGRNYVKSERALANYFRSAAGVARIRSLIQSSDDVEQLKQLIKIQYQDKMISWNDFYFEQSRYSALSKKLESKKISYPVAIGISIKAHHHDDKWKFPYCVQGYTDTKKIDEVTRIYVPRIRAKRNSLIDCFKVDSTYIVVGNAWLSRVSDVDNPYRNIQMVIYKKQQFVKDIS